MKYYNNQCEFCREFTYYKSKYDRIIKQFNEEYFLLTTIGCFIEGYTLLLPKKHVLSFANLSTQTLDILEPNIESIRDRIENYYSRSVIIAEHGSGIHDLGASSCEHAHFHFIPIINPIKVLNTYLSTDEGFNVYGNLSSIKKYSGISYIYLSIKKKQHFVWKATKRFSRQYVRRVTSQIEGVEKYYNWRFFPFENNIRKTTNELRKEFNTLNFVNQQSEYKGKSSK